MLIYGVRKEDLENQRGYLLHDQNKIYTEIDVSYAKVEAFSKRNSQG